MGPSKAPYIPTGHLLNPGFPIDADVGMHNQLYEKIMADIKAGKIQVDESRLAKLKKKLFGRGNKGEPANSISEQEIAGAWNDSASTLVNDSRKQ